MKMHIFFHFSDFFLQKSMREVTKYLYVTVNDIFFSVLRMIFFAKKHEEGPAKILCTFAKKHEGGSENIKI